MPSPLNQFPQLTGNSTSTPVGAGTLQTWLNYKLGYFPVFAMSTFAGTELTTGAESINTFAPTAGQVNCAAWATAAKAMGATYAVFTVKDQGGFALWPTAQTTYGIASTTWYANNGHQDIVGAYVTAFRAAGFKVGIYYNVKDLNWQAAHPGWTSSQFTAYVQAQLTELAAYAPDIIWFDEWASGGGPGFETVVYSTIYAAIKALLPNCMIIVNNTGGSNLGDANRPDSIHGDIMSWEEDVAGFPPLTNSLVGEVSETATVLNHWYNHGSETYKTATALAADIVEANSRNATLLIDFPPGASGALDAAAQSIMSAIPAAVAAATLSPTSVAVPSVPLQPNTFLAGPYAGAASLAVPRTLTDADLLVFGLHVALTNQNNSYRNTTQQINVTTSNTFSSGWQIQKRGTTGNEFAAVTSNTQLGIYQVMGWDGSGYGIGGNLNFATAENYSPTAHGTNLLVNLAPPGSTALTAVCTFEGNGTVLFSNGASIDPSGNISTGGTIVAIGDVTTHGVLTAMDSNVTVTNTAGGVNPQYVATDGTMTAVLQVVTGAWAIVGTTSAHDFSIRAGGTDRIKYRKNGEVTAKGNTAAIVLATGNTITTTGVDRIIRLAPTGAVTGIIMGAGITAGGGLGTGYLQEVILRNESAFTITFAASGSNTFGGSAVSVPAFTSRLMTWDGSLWN